jgi:cation:H+ antiporter
MIGFYLLLLAAGIFFLLKATKFTIKLIERIGFRVRIPTIILSSMFLAMATSFPELFVGIISAINEDPLLSLGNVFGANMTNLTLILGLATVFVGETKIRHKFIFKDVLVTFLIAFLPYFLLLDRTLSRKDGLILLIVYFFYNLFLFKEERVKLKHESPKELKKTEKLFLQLFFWVAVLAGSAQLIVIASERISQLINFPLVLIGIFILALGTTLPELVVQIKSAEEREDGVFFGNIFGSIVANSCLVLGTVALICPIRIIESRHFLTSGAFTLLAFFLLPFFLRSKRRLERSEGVMLLLIYLVFIFAGFFLSK